MPGDATFWTWFTRDLLPDGGQTCILARSDAREARIELDADQSRLLQAVLNEIARDDALPFSSTRQAVLRGFAAAASP